MFKEDLEDYYIKNNKSKFRNGYHGIMHVKLMLKSLSMVVETHKTMSSSSAVHKIWDGIERIMRLAIWFHDFNYQGVSSNPYYDMYNIIEALKAFDEFVDAMDCYTHLRNPYFYEVPYSNIQYNIARNLIQATEYPTYEMKHNALYNGKYDNYFMGVLDGPGLIDLIRDIDHSMPIFDEYLYLCWQFLTFDRNCEPTMAGYINGCGTYLKNLNFKLPIFQQFWTEKRRKQQITKVHNLIAVAHLRDWFGKDYFEFCDIQEFEDKFGTLEIQRI